MTSTFSSSAGSFLDVLVLDKTWSLAYVTEVLSDSLIVKYSYNDSDFSEKIQLTSHRLAPFRSKSKCGIDSKPIRWNLSIETMTEMTEYAKNGRDEMMAYQDPKAIINFFRGVLYCFAESLVRFRPKDAREANIGVQFFEEMSRLGEVWIRNFPSLERAWQMIYSNNEDIYSSAEAAEASIWPELFHVLEMLLGTAPHELSFHHVSFI